MPDIKEILKRIKKLQSSVMVANPTVKDNTSELLRNISVLSGGDVKRK